MPTSPMRGVEARKVYLVLTVASAPPSWEQFKREHPVGSKVTGTVCQVAPFGVFVDLGVSFTALLLVPEIAPIRKPKSFPDDYPKIGDEISALIRHYGDAIGPNGVGKIALTQNRESLRAEQF